MMPLVIWWVVDSAGVSEEGTESRTTPSTVLEEASDPLSGVPAASRVTLLTWTGASLTAAPFSSASDASESLDSALEEEELLELSLFEGFVRFAGRLSAEESEEDSSDDDDESEDEESALRFRGLLFSTVCAAGLGDGFFVAFVFFVAITSCSSSASLSEEEDDDDEGELVLELDDEPASFDLTFLLFDSGFVLTCASCSGSSSEEEVSLLLELELEVEFVDALLPSESEFAPALVLSVSSE
jgi:hypothetical protein